MNYRPRLKRCPHCGEYGFEKLKTYSHCVSCLYVKDRMKKERISSEKKEKSLERKRLEKERTLLLKSKKKLKKRIEACPFITTGKAS